MKLRIIASALLIIVLSAGFSVPANAAPWRHGRVGWYAPRPVVRFGIPVPPIPQVVFGGGYYGGYYGHPYHGGYGGPRYYAHGGYGGYGHYGHGYRGGYGHYGHGHYGRR